MIDKNPKTHDSKPKGYRCGVSPPKQEIEVAPNEKTTIKLNKHVSIVSLLYY